MREDITIIFYNKAEADAELEALQDIPELAQIEQELAEQE